MIFKQVDEILSGRKTQTRRLALPWPDGTGTYASEMIGFPHGVQAVRRNGGPDDNRWHTLWAVGRAYAVVPKRGQPAVWWAYEAPPNSQKILTASVHKVNRATFAEEGWQPLCIRITAIRRERLQDITEADARAEGVDSVEKFKELWDRINAKKGTRWSDNPDVWVLEFELARGR